MSDLHQQILEMLESNINEFSIAEMLDIPVAWVFEAQAISE